MTRIRRARNARTVLIVLLALGFPNHVVSEIQSGALRGQVTDPSGAVVMDASVLVISAAGQRRAARTNQEGTYEVKNLPRGRYTVSIAAKGFAKYTSQSIEIVGSPRTLDIVLRIEVEPQNVVVTDDAGTAVDVNSANNVSATTMIGKSLEALSDDPGELESELKALAGASSGPNDGQLYVEGFTADHAPPKASIREIRINQDPFSAEYDRLGYGRIEILTKAGSDKFHAEVLLDGNTSGFNSRNPFITQEPSYDSTQFSGSVGGPINKRASFFFNVQRGNINDEAAINAFVLDPSFNQTPLRAVISTPKESTSISPRLDYQLDKNDTLTARYQFFEGNQSNQGVGQFSLPSQGYDAGETEHMLQVSDAHVLSANAVSQTGFQYVRDQSDQTSQYGQPTVSVLGAFTGGGNSLGDVGDRTDRYEVYNRTSMSRRSHQIKFGARLRAYRDVNNSTSGFNGTFIFPSLTTYQITQQGLQQGLTPAQIRSLGGGPSQFSISTGNPRADITLVDAAVYAEDQWRLRANLALSYGLRFETQNLIHDHADLAPRVAIAWGVGGKKSQAPKTVIRTGFGLFYDRFPYGLALQAERLNGIHATQFMVNEPAFFPNVPTLNTLQGTQTFPTIYEIDAKVHAPYTVQTAVSIERQISKNANLAVSYLHSRGVDALLSRNINAPLPGTYSPSDPASGIRPFGPVGNIYQYESEGIFKQQQLIANLNLRHGSKLSLQGYYVLNYANSDTAGPSSFPSNQYDLAADYGRAAYDNRHRLFVGGTVALPYGCGFSPFILARSGLPFNITLGQDLNGDSIFNDRPAFATNPQRSTVVVTRFGIFDKSPIPGETIIPINYGTGPGLFTLNLRITKTIGFGGRPRQARGSSPSEPGTPSGHQHITGFASAMRGLLGSGNSTDHRYDLTLGLSALNLLNHVNLALPVGNINSPLFGESNALAGEPYSSSAANRTIHLQAALRF
jgi:hypothetical protein